MNSSYLFLFLSISIISQNAFSQKIDYLDIRDSIKNFSCGPGTESSHVFGTMRRLEALDTNKIGKNIHIYYEDLGICYWLAAGNSKMDYLQKSVEVNRIALYHKPKSTRAMWDLAFSYARLDDCEQAKYYLNLYAKHTPKKYLDETYNEQVGQILAMCHFDPDSYRD